MNLVLFHFASGASLFSGACLLLSALAFSFVVRNKWPKVVVRLGSMLGLILIVVSSTPISPPLFCALIVCSFACLAPYDKRTVGYHRFALAIRGVAIGLMLLTIGLELPYWFAPRLSVAAQTSAAQGPLIYVLGDSLSAELRDGERVWPLLLGESHDLEVFNLAQAGATAETALPQVDRVTSSPALVIIEIGGNDLLGSTSADDFAAALANLLEAVAGEGRQLLMFELPLPLLKTRFGRAQRQLARKHQVRLIPKRLLSRVLREPAMTVDGLHPSPKGHEALAELTWKIIAPVFGK